MSKNNSQEYFDKFSDFFEDDSKTNLEKQEKQNDFQLFQEELDKFTEEESKINSNTLLIDEATNENAFEENFNDNSVIAFEDTLIPASLETYDNSIGNMQNFGDSYIVPTIPTEEFNDTYKLENDNIDKKNNKDKEYKISKDIMQMIMLVVSGVVLVLSIWIMVKSFSPEQKYSKPILSYSLDNGIKAKIHLNNNNFYENKYLGMNELVPAPFIKEIELDFSSRLQAQQKLDYNYNYNITGEITASYTGGAEDKKGIIWSKKYTFISSVSNSIKSSSNVRINPKVKIDYSKYNNLVNQYKLKASVPMEAYLTVKFEGEINADIKDSNKKLNQEIATSVKIPLSVATVRLSTQDTTSGSKVLSDIQTIEASKNYILLGFSIILFIVSAGVTVKLLINLKKMTENHSVLFKLNKILKDHDQVVVEVESLPKIKNATIIEIKQFKDMIDIQQELHIPILYYKSEIVTENTFYIIHNNQVYKYVINSEMEQI